MTAYNITGNISTITQAWQISYAATDGWISLSMLILIWIIAFISFKYYETPEAVAGASFITGFLSVLLWVVDLAPDKWMWFFVLLSAFSILYLMIRRGD